MRQIRGSRPTWMWIVQGGWLVAVLGFGLLLDDQRIEFSGPVYFIFISAAVVPGFALSWYAERTAKRSFVKSLPRPGILTPPQ